MFHKILQRQLKKYIGDENNPPKEWEEFLTAISETYTHYDEDHTLIERSLDISSREHTEYTKALKESEERFKTLTRFAPVGIFLADASGQLLFVNERWTEYSGLTLEEAKGIGWEKAIHPEDRERLKTEWFEHVKMGTDYKGEFRFQDKNGMVRWVSTSAIPLHDGEKIITGYVGTSMDITSEKDSQNTLQMRTKELEHLNTTMIGRELKMIELKKEIDRLRGLVNQS